MTRWTSDLARASDWMWLTAPVLVVLAAAWVLVVVGGRHGTDPRLARSRHGRFAEGLGFVLHVPAWVAAPAMTALVGAATAGFGFRWDIGWHLQHGRDASFAPPHLLTFFGTALIEGAAVLAVVLATEARVNTTWRLGSLRVSVGAALLGAIGVASAAGLVIDDVWHRALGKDASVWSPPHLFMLAAGALVGTVVLLMLVESGALHRGSRDLRVRALGLGCFATSLASLTALQVEANSGGPRALQVQHPILIAVAAALVLPGARLLLGRGAAVLTALALAAVNLAPFVPPFSLPQAREPLYLGAAVGVELVAELWSRRGLRWRTVWAGGAVIGLLAYLGEQLWSQGWHQPWPVSMAAYGAPAAATAAAAAVVFGIVVLAAAGVVSLPATRLAPVALAIVLLLVGVTLVRADRTVDVEVAVDEGDLARVVVTFADADEPEDANWFQVSAFGEGLFVTDFDRVGRSYVSRQPVPMSGDWRTVLRFHEGRSMLLVPLHFPVDDAIGVGPIDTRRFRGAMPSEGSAPILELGGLPSPRTLFVGYLAAAAVFALWAAALVGMARRIAAGDVAAPDAELDAELDLGAAPVVAS